jgi:hypothetical protein
MNNESIEMIKIVEWIDANNEDSYEDKHGEDEKDDDELSEFTEKSYENDFEKEYEDKYEDKHEAKDKGNDVDEDSLENTIYSELDSILDFIFDYDIIPTPENFYELDHFTKIKNKIINKIKLDKNDLLYIKAIDGSKKFELLKLFNWVL